MAEPAFQEDYEDEIPQSVVRQANPDVANPYARQYTSLQDMITPVAAQKADVLERKIAADEGVFGRMRGQVAEDRARMTRAFDAMGVEAEKLQPWDADAMREKFRTDPIASFGSLGSVFAMIASAFTHAPMTNALNASAAAMMAIKDGNEAEYEKAFRAFKENNDLVIKRHGMMNQAYQNAATLMDKDIAAGKISLLENATRFGDQNLAVMLNNGMDKEALDYVSSFGKMTRDQLELNDYLNERAFKFKVFEQGLANIRQTVENPQERAGHELALYRRVFDKKESKPADAAFGHWLMTEGLTKSPDEVMAKAHEFDRKFSRQNTDLYLAETAAALEKENLEKGMSPGEAKRDALERATRAGSKMSAGRAVVDRTVMADQAIAELEKSFGVVPPDVRTMIHQAHEAKGSTAPLHLAQVGAAIDELKTMKENGVDVTPDKISSVMSNAFSAKPNITSDAIEFGAELFLKGNPAWMIGGGSRAQGAANQQAIKNRAAEKLMVQQGLSPEEAAQQVNQASLQMQAYKRGASNLGQRLSTTYGAANLALSTADRVVEASEKVDRTKFTNLNEIILMAQRRTGGENVIRLGIAADTLAREYARAAVGGSNQLTDSAQKIARSHLQEAWSKGQIRAAVDQMKIELGDMRRGAEESLRDWGQGTKLFGGLEPAEKTNVTTDKDGTRWVPTGVPGVLQEVK